MTQADAHEKSTVLSHNRPAGTAKMPCYVCVAGGGGKQNCLCFVKYSNTNLDGRWRQTMVSISANF